MAQATGSGNAGGGGAKLMGLFRLLFSVGADATNFRVGMKQVESVAQRATSRIAGYMAGAFSVTAMAALTNRTIEFASKMSDLAQRVGSTAEEMQELNYAATQTGASIDDIAAAMKRLATARAAALGGSDKTAAAFRSAGISDAQLRTQSIATTFKQIADNVRSMGASADRGAIVTALFGRGGDRLIPMFNEGLSELTDQARKAGIVMDETLIASLEKAGDAMDALKLKSQSFFGQAIGGAQLLYRTYERAFAINRELNAQGAPSNFAAALEMARTQLAAEDRESRLMKILGAPQDAGIASGISGGGRSRFSTVSRNQDFGSLASVGGFFGLGGTRDATVTYLKRIEDNTKKTADNTDPNKEGDDF